MAIFQTNEENENEEDNHHHYDADLERLAVETIESVGFDAAIIPNLIDYLATTITTTTTTNTRNTLSEEASVVVSALLEAPQEYQNPGDDNEIVLSVRGMSCAVCIGRAERALQQAMIVITAPDLRSHSPRKNDTNGDDEDDTIITTTTTSLVCQNVMVILANGGTGKLIVSNAPLLLVFASFRIYLVCIFIHQAYAQLSSYSL
jgi:hypothetical protein